MPERHHFISYSTVDAQDFAEKLHDALEADGIPMWLDKRDLLPARRWDVQIDEGIRDARTLIFVMTPDSVTETSVCQDEWSRALQFKKPVVTLRLDPEAAPPFRLQDRQWIDFAAGFDAGLAKLRQYLLWLETDEGKLQQLKDRLKDAQRDLRRARDETDRRRIEQQISDLQEDIKRQQAIVDDPAGAAQRTAESIERRLQLVRQPEHPPPAADSRRIINHPPAGVPRYFQDRYYETGQVGAFLKDPFQRMLTIVGRGGVGKTAMTVRVMKALERNELPDNRGHLDVNGIVYLSAVGARRVNVPNIYADLSKLLAPATTAQLETLYMEPTVSTTDKIKALLAHFLSGRYVLLLDNFETLVDEKGQITDADLQEALAAFLSAPPHGVKVIITTREAPIGLLRHAPQLQQRLDLDQGLPSPHAENILREMDSDGVLGLRDLAPDDPMLREARERTRGYPRALEALYGMMMAEYGTSLRDVLDRIQEQDDDTLVEVMVGEAFNHLDPLSQHVLQALAIYGRPVPSVAVDYLLQDIEHGIDSAPLLRRLVNAHFARLDQGQFYLHPVDEEYALSLLEEGEAEPQPVSGLDRLLAEALGEDIPEPQPPAFSTKRLYERAAEYFHQTRKPRDEWQTIEDLRPILDEFDMRYAAGDFDAAAGILAEIDFDYLYRWGHWRLMMELHEKLRGKITDSRAMRGSLGNLGTAYYVMGYLRAAVEAYQAALDSAREDEDTSGIGVWLGNLGLAYAGIGDTRQAIACYEQSLQISRDNGDRKGQAVNLGNLGGAYQAVGQVRRAIECFEESLRLAHEIGDPYGEASALAGLASIYELQGDMGRALDTYQQSLEITRRANDRPREGSILGSIGGIYHALGDVKRAIDHYQEALTISREIGSRAGEAGELGRLGNAYSDLGDVQKSIAHYEEALQISTEMGDRPSAGAWLGNLGNRYLEIGDTDKALDYYNQSVTIRRETENLPGVAIDLYNIGLALLDKQENDDAAAHFQQVIQMADDLDYRLMQGWGRYGVGFVALVQDKAEAARRALGEALRFAGEDNRHEFLVMMGVALLRLGNPDEARTYFTDTLEHTDILLEKEERNYQALDGRALALAGLAVVTQESSYRQRAIETYRRARSILAEAGTAREVLRSYAELKKADAGDFLTDDVRRAAAGR